MCWLKDGSKAYANIVDEGRGANGQEEQVEGMVSDGSKANANIADEGRRAKGQEEQLGWDGNKADSKTNANIADEGLGATGQEEQVEGMVFKVGGKY